MEEDKKLWLSLMHEFPILNMKNEVIATDSVYSFDELVDELERRNLLKMAYETVYLRIEDHLRCFTIPEIARAFACENPTPVEGFKVTQRAVKMAYTAAARALPTLKRAQQLKERDALEESSTLAGKTLAEWYKLAFVGGTLFELPATYDRPVRGFYNIAFRAFCACGHPPYGTVDIVCTDHPDSLNCNCKYVLTTFDCINRMLSELGLLEKMVGAIITDLVQTWSSSHVDKQCKGAFENSNMKIIDNWIDDIMMVWLTRVYKIGTRFTVFEKEIVEMTVTHFREKLVYYVHEVYGRLLIDQLFNIIIEYPDSHAAIEDLRMCLNAQLQASLIQKTRDSFTTRLLHPGVNTPDILTAYIASIHALQQLDPSGILLDTVTSPIRSYLRRRDDTVHCIVTSLTEDEPSDLSDELSGCKKISLTDAIAVTDDNIENWESWAPDPVEVVPGVADKRDRSSDIITMLVNVFGSKQMFIDEYRKLLADRFLTHFSFNTDKEIRYLELLKLRFGDGELHKCEVMLKDIYDSVRIGSNLQSEETYGLQNLDFSIRGVFVSAQFWPPFKENTLKLPPSIAQAFETYTAAYEMYKRNRTLSWKPHLGMVNIEIELKNQTLNLTVSPILATIIWHFQEKSEWNLLDLSVEMMVSHTVLKRKISYWQTQGVLAQIGPDQFVLREEMDSAAQVIPQTAANLSTLYDDEEMDSAIASARDQREEELQVFWSYIVGMLTNLESLTLDRIHQMLKMFASHGSSNKEVSVEQLKSFLEKKVTERLLTVSAGYYKLAK